MAKTVAAHDSGKCDCRKTMNTTEEIATMPRRTIDYIAQFVTVDEAAADNIDCAWKRRREYRDARAAFESARRSEARGVVVGFARVGAYFVVWSDPYTTA